MRLFLFLIFLLTPSMPFLWAEDEPKTIEFQDFDEGSQAHGAAYLGDAMYPRTPMPSHADWKPMPFYYKHCTEVGPRFYYSKTAYDCTTIP